MITLLTRFSLRWGPRGFISRAKLKRNVAQKSETYEGNEWPKANHTSPTHWLQEQRCTHNDAKEPGSNPSGCGGGGSARSHALIQAGARCDRRVGGASRRQGARTCTKVVDIWTKSISDFLLVVSESSTSICLSTKSTRGFREWSQNTVTTPVMSDATSERVQPVNDGAIPTWSRRAQLCRGGWHYWKSGTQV